MANKKSKNKKEYLNQDFVESFKGIGSGIVDSATSDLGKGLMTGMWEQFLGADTEKKKKQTSGELSEGEEVNLKELQEESRKTDIEPGIDYHGDIIHGEKRIAKEQEYALQNQIEQILVELQRIIASSKELEVQFREVTVEKRPVKSGKYHVTFMEWLLATVQTARMRIEDSASWLAVFKSKKGKKQYWNMFEEYGTTFGLSNERVVATQTG